jgi:cob(I)alamin adenosyltransferase
MGKRLTRIYTRTGDNGTSGLADGSRVAKDDPRMEAIGAVDELNSAVGLILAEALPDDARNWLVDVQHDLFDLGGELSIPGHTLITVAHVGRLERTIDEINATLAPLEDFILPGGTSAAAHTHLARAVCRRAERRLVTLSKTQPLAPPLVQYVNRLSDLLFILARALNRHGGQGDVLWQQGKNR